MGWKMRRGRRYYYRSRWENGRTVTEYVGCGPEAEAAAELDLMQVIQRDQDRANRLQSQVELDQLDATLEWIDRIVGGMVAAAMEAAGFHRHRGQWRKRTMDTSKQPQVAPPRPSRAELIANPQLVAELEKRAGAGDYEAFLSLLPVFDRLHLTETVGDMSMRSLQVALAGVAGKDLLTQEAVLRRMDQIRIALCGPSPTMLEQLLVDRVVAMWFHLHKLERDSALIPSGDTRARGDFQKSITLAQKRYFSAMRELTMLRRQAMPVLHPAAPTNLAHLKDMTDAKEEPPAELPKAVEAPKPREAPEG